MPRRSFPWAFLVLEEHPYGREMLRELLASGFVPTVVLEERSRLADVERRKFLERISGQNVPPTFDELLAEHDGVERGKVSHHNGDECAAILGRARPELIVLGGTRILKPHVFEAATVGTLNSHPGLLPEVRGSASVAWAIHLDVEVGCTCHFIEAGIDTGPVVGRRTIDVHRGDTYERLCSATIALSAVLMREALEAHAADVLHGEPQPPGGEALRNMEPAMVEGVRRKLAEGRYLHFVD